MVAWLENQKIREYPEEERTGLCGSHLVPCLKQLPDVGGAAGAQVAWAEWRGHLQKYAEDLSLRHSADSWLRYSSGEVPSPDVCMCVCVQPCD